MSTVSDLDNEITIRYTDVVEVITGGLIARKACIVHDTYLACNIVSCNISIQVTIIGHLANPSHVGMEKYVCAVGSVFHRGCTGHDITREVTAAVVFRIGRLVCTRIACPRARCNCYAWHQCFRSVECFNLDVVNKQLGIGSRAISYGTYADTDTTRGGGC